MKPAYAIFAVVAAIGIVIDQVSKWWIVANIELYRGEIIVLPGWISIVHAQNPGAAMGILRDSPYRLYIFAAFSLLALGVVVNLVRQLKPHDWYMATTLGMILGGAVGNAIDRVRQQYVTDFIRVYTETPALESWLVQTFKTSEWPSFNFADSALVIGVLLFLVHYAFFEGKGDAEAPAAEPAPE